MEGVKTIRVLRIINRFNLGGPTYNVTYLTAYLSEEFKTKLVGGFAEESEGDALFIPQQHSIDPQVINNLQRDINFRKDVKAYQEIKAIIKDFRPDIVHTHAAKAGALGRLAAYRTKVPVIVHTFHGHVFHSYFGNLKTQVFKHLERYLAKKSTAIIAISNQQKYELVHEHKIAIDDKVKVINLGFDLDRFQTDKEIKRFTFVADYEIDEDAICIGIIGRLTAIKNHDMFFEVINRVFNKTAKKCHVFVIGDGELKLELETKAEAILEKYPKQKISFTSWIKDVSIPLARMDIICLTSFNEGTPVSLIEAQAANVAVISTNVGGVRDIVNDGKTGIVVDSLQTNEYAKRLLSLLENQDKLAAMKAGGWDFVREKFHYKTLCLNIERLYLSLLNRTDD